MRWTAVPTPKKLLAYLVTHETLLAKDNRFTLVTAMRQLAFASARHGGQGSLGTLLMGSVATQALSHSKVPVLLVR